MDLHPLVSGFEHVAEDYERGRPGYPPEVIAALRDGLGLAEGARIADVGAGTGKLTRALIAAGFDVVAVEPLDALRARLASGLPGLEPLSGTAEALPLADASVDAVACSDAFHWFDAARAAPELARVIRPGGGLALLWNHEAPGAEAPSPWATELGALLDGLRPDHPAFTGDQGRAAIDAHPAFAQFRCTEVDRLHRTDRTGLVANVASISYVGVLPDAERRALLERIDALLAANGVAALDVPLRTMVWTARRV